MIFCIDSCPKDCSGHGICSTIGDASYFSGPDYNPQYFQRGDGYGPVYKNWDSQSIQMCECDDGFFGPDCSRCTSFLFLFLCFCIYLYFI